MTAAANPRYRLAPRTSALMCVPTAQNSFTSMLCGIPKRLHCKPLMPTLNSFPHHRQKHRTQQHSAKP